MTNLGYDDRRACRPSTSPPAQRRTAGSGKPGETARHNGGGPRPRRSCPAAGWRRFEVVRRAEREPIVLCGSCRARFGERSAGRTQARARAGAHCRRGQAVLAAEARRGRAPDRPAPGSPPSGAWQAAGFVLDDDGCPSGRPQQRQDTRPVTTLGASRRGPARRQPLVDRPAPRRARHGDGSACGADEQPPDRQRPSAGRLACELLALLRTRHFNGAALVSRLLLGAARVVRRQPKNLAIARTFIHEDHYRALNDDGKTRVARAARAVLFRVESGWWSG